MMLHYCPWTQSCGRIHSELRNVCATRSSNGARTAVRTTAPKIAPLTNARGWGRSRSASARLVCLVFFLTVAIRCTAGPVPRALLKGTVTDSEGAAIRGAHIIVRWDPAGADVGLQNNVGLKHYLDLVTDKKGVFASELPPGFYDVFVSATAFSPECRKVRIKPGLTFVYKARLRVDPRVTRELGDTLSN